MKTVLLLAVATMLALISIGCSSNTVVAPEPTVSPEPTVAPEPTVPPYVVPIFVSDELGNVLAMANAVLVDKDRSLFVTNAHVVAIGTVLDIPLGKTLYPARTQERWINWEADLALVELLFDAEQIKILNSFGAPEDQVAIPVLPEVLPTFAEPPRVLSPVRTMGYTIATDEGVVSVAPYIVDALLVGTNAHWEVVSGVSELELMIAFDIEGKGISEEYRHFFYKNYIEIQQPEEDLSINNFQSGTSGSAVITENGGFLGILSGGSQDPTPFVAVVVPASEIKALIESSLE